MLRPIPNWRPRIAALPYPARPSRPCWQATANGMKLQLLQLLRSDVQLAVCLRVVGYLRRLDSYGEVELRSTFLECRDRWLQDTISDIPEARLGSG